MSFTEFLQDDPLLTREQVMSTLIQVASEQAMPDQRGAAIVAGITVSQECGIADGDAPFARRFWCPANPADAESVRTNPDGTPVYPHDSMSNDGRSVGYFQQQKGPNGELWWGTTASEMDLHSAATTFMQRLKAVGYDASTAQSANDAAQSVQQSGVPNAYGQWFGDITSLYSSVSNSATAQPTPPTTTPGGNTVADADRPDFNEYWVQSDNSQDRAGTTIDLWLIHTQEGDGNADDLAHFLVNSANTANPVSYHYTISWDATDGGVTVCDVVDTDLASWSVMNSNDRSINLCFAGSYEAWTRQEWLDNVGRAIDVAAYLCAQDCLKYGIAPNVIPGPNYNAAPPGVSDHRYCSDYLKDGNDHTDVGDGFPWNVFATAVAGYYAALSGAATPPPAQPAQPAPLAPIAAPDQETATDLVIEQLLGPWDSTAGQFTGWPQLSGNAAALADLQAKVNAGTPLSLVDGVAALRWGIKPQAAA